MILNLNYPNGFYLYHCLSSFLFLSLSLFLTLNKFTNPGIITKPIKCRNEIFNCLTRRRGLLSSIQSTRNQIPHCKKIHRTNPPNNKFAPFIYARSVPLINKQRRIKGLMAPPRTAIKLIFLTHHGSSASRRGVC